MARRKRGWHTTSAKVAGYKLEAFSGHHGGSVVYYIPSESLDMALADLLDSKLDDFHDIDIYVPARDGRRGRCDVPGCCWMLVRSVKPIENAAVA